MKGMCEHLIRNYYVEYHYNVELMIVLQALYYYYYVCNAIYTTDLVK